MCNKEGAIYVSKSNKEIDASSFINIVEKMETGIWMMR